MTDPGTIPPGAKKDPLNHIEWVHATMLNANNYNPNRVFRAELELLERNMLSLGWVQPILANLNDLIIDGFHRWRLSQDSAALMGRYGGYLPVARLDVDDDVAMAITVRMNRAKGTHTASSMSELVHTLVNDRGWSRERMAAEIGATLDEVDLLLEDSVFTRKKIDKWAYSEAWYPVRSDATDVKEKPSFGGYADSGIGNWDEAKRAGVVTDDDER